jgi:hypothetical protein
LVDNADYTKLKCGLTLLTAEHALIGGVALIRCIILFLRADNQRACRLAAACAVVSACTILLPWNQTSLRPAIANRLLAVDRFVAIAGIPWGAAALLSGLPIGLLFTAFTFVVFTCTPLQFNLTQLNPLAQPDLLRVF